MQQVHKELSNKRLCRIAETEGRPNAKLSCPKAAPCPNCSNQSPARRPSEKPFRRPYLCLTQDAQVIIGCKIDMNLTATQSMMGMLDGIDTADSDYLENKISEARWFAGIGTAGPAIVAGTMLIMFRIAIALFIGFAPIFILCLLFKKTAPLFQKWLYYGLATVFSSVMLGVMADIAIDLVSNIAITDAVTRIASILGGGGLSGIMRTVTQQLGLGLMLSPLLIVVPPMAGAWFNGVMGSFNGYNPIERWNNLNGQ